MSQIRSILTISAAAAPPAPVVPPAQTRAVAAQLAKLFADFDTNAVTFAEQNESILRPAFDADSWARFRRHTEGFAFAEAQTLLNQALANLPES
jgi:hypothetical protein